jgi:ArsR family transcriptional regulator, arsenate/arsenite/antimonite-responsive transcriptional repressor
MVDAPAAVRTASPATGSGAAPGDVSPAAGAFLRLVADPTRRRIFFRLMAGELCNCEMVDALGLPQNLISHHLRQLREAGLVRTRRDPEDARWVYYRVDPAALAAVQAEVAAAFAPTRLGDRQPVCGPAARGAAGVLPGDPCAADEADAGGTAGGGACAGG